MDAATIAAIAAATKAFNIELWTLYGFGECDPSLRITVGAGSIFIGSYFD